MVKIMFYIWGGFSCFYIGCQLFDFFSILRGHKIKEILRSNTIRKQLDSWFERYYHSSWCAGWAMSTVIVLISFFLQLVSRQ